MHLLALPLLLSSFVLVGDSIVSSDLQPTIQGWGVPLPGLLSQPVTNLAVAGASSKSYYQTHWTPSTTVQPGDVVLIEFGHNDIAPDSHGTTPSEYASYLTNFVNDTRARHATPILVTPLNAYLFTANLPVPYLPDYVSAMHSVATTLNVQLIDLHQWSIDRFTHLGEVQSRAIFQVHSSDLIHMTPAGATEAATFISSQLAAVPEPSSFLCLFVVAGLTQSRRLVRYLRGTNSAESVA